MGGERDQGADTQQSIGPGQFAINSLGNKMLVSQFNANALTFYDVESGIHGSIETEWRDIGENPYAVAFSPDGRYGLVATYTGEYYSENPNLMHSTLLIYDTDPQSSTYLQLLTRIANLKRSQ